MAPRRSGRGRTQQHQSNIAHPNAHKDDQHPSSSSSSSSNFDKNYHIMSLLMVGRADCRHCGDTVHGTVLHQTKIKSNIGQQTKCGR